MSNVSRKARDSGIGRLLVASLHQAIGDVLPARLEFYEHWLRPEGLHQGSVGRAPLAAVLGFLRTEAAYDSVVRQGGTLAADWARANGAGATVWMARLLPLPLAADVALCSACRLVHDTNHLSRARARLRRGAGLVEIEGSVFCDVRAPVSRPLCGYYAAAVTRVLRQHGLDGEARPDRCRGVGDPQCALAVEIRGRISPEKVPCR